MSEEQVARAIAYFAICDDLRLLQEVLRSIQPRASAEVRRRMAARQDIPAPADIDAADEPAGRQEALAITRDARDFSELMAISRAVGRRVEELQAKG
jgi:hypothetical protein